jgi:hypothetical protein
MSPATFLCNSGRRQSQALKCHIQSVNIYMSQRSVIDRWVECDHILLIHPCPETLCLRARASEM